MAINLGRAIARGIAGTTQPYADRINAEKDAEVARRIKMADIPVVAAEAKAIAKAEHPFLMAQNEPVEHSQNQQILLIFLQMHFYQIFLETRRILLLLVLQYLFLALMLLDGRIN
tara:strand:+ start:1773 stop:2117 length:345 start_codon:yes stop_codon:yes gene_type:complete